MQRTRISTPHYYVASPYNHYGYHYAPHYVVTNHQHQYYGHTRQRQGKVGVSYSTQPGNGVEMMSTQSKLSDEDLNNINNAKCPTNLRRIVSDPKDSQSAYLRAVNANQTPVSTNPELISRETSEQETKLPSTNSTYRLNHSH